MLFKVITEISGLLNTLKFIDDIPIPIIDKGLLSPEKKCFPNYDAGEFKVSDTIMIVNRGIGISSINLRVFNKPEISVITLKSN